VWTGFIWLKIGASRGGGWKILVNIVLNSWAPLRAANWLAEWLSASQEWLCSMESVYKIMCTEVGESSTVVMMRIGANFYVGRESILRNDGYDNKRLLPDDAESSITNWPIGLNVLGVRMRRRRWRLLWMCRMIRGLRRREDGLLVSSPSSPALHEWHGHSGVSTWANNSHEVAVNLAVCLVLYVTLTFRSCPNYYEHSVLAVVVLELHSSEQDGTKSGRWRERRMQWSPKWH
jgi:hypothetical protein